MDMRLLSVEISSARSGDAGLETTEVEDDLIGADDPEEETCAARAVERRRRRKHGNSSRPHQELVFFSLVAEDRGKACDRWNARQLPGVVVIAVRRAGAEGSS